MLMPIVAILCTLTAVVGSVGASAQPRVDVPTMFTGAIRPLQPPDGAGSWQLQVITRGGIGGRGTGDFAINSSGSLTLFAPDTTVAVQADALGRLREYVSTSTPSQWSVKPWATLCSDCVSTLVVLTVRTPTGGIETYTAVWDPTMRARVSPDAVRIHDLALRVRRAIDR